MLKEIAIFFYLLMYRLFFHAFFFARSVTDKKIVMVVSFPGNGGRLYKSLKEKDLDEKLVILAKPNVYDNFKSRHDSTFLIESRNIIHTLKGIFYLRAAKVIVVDNYFGFLSALDLKKDVTCIQMWHANGAIKKFGMEDPDFKTASKRVQRRHRSVYNKFQHIVVGSDAMGEVFKQAFGAKEEQLLKIGVPSTDFFFEKHEKQSPFGDKKVILYAPTFRKKNNELLLELETMHRSLNENYILLLKLHPNLQKTFSVDPKYKDFLFDYTYVKDITELLPITDILITDYTSISMEFSFMNKPMLFFAPDLEEYEVERGFWEEYEISVPGGVYQTTNELIEGILSLNNGQNKGEVESRTKFHEKWNKYNEGSASESLAEVIK